MPMKHLSTLLILVPLLFAGNANADQHRGTKGHTAVSESEAARIVRQKKGGRVLDVKRQNRNGQTDYRVKTIENGRVRVYGVDGHTGKLR